MSDFWDNNKESIFKGAKTAGKYSYKGAKFVGKSGYQAVKNQRAVNAGRPIETEKKTPDFGEVRPVSSLPKVDNLPPPPIRPGQNQYTSKSRTPPAAQLATAQTTQYVPGQSVQYTQQAEQRPLPTPGNPPAHQQAQQGPVQYQQNTYPASPQQNQQYGSSQIVEQQQYQPQYQQYQQYAQASQAPQQQSQVPVPPRSNTADIKNSGNIRIPESQLQIQGQNIKIPSYSINGQQAMSMAGKFMSGMSESQNQPQQQQQQQQQQEQSQQVQQKYQQPAPEQYHQPVQQQYHQPAQQVSEQYQQPPQQQIYQENVQQYQQPAHQSAQQQLQEQLQRSMRIDEPTGQAVVEEKKEVQTPAPALDFKNPYYKGAVSTPANEPSSASSMDNVPSAPLPVPGPRNYSRAPAVPPPQQSSGSTSQLQNELPITVQQQQHVSQTQPPGAQFIPQQQSDMKTPTIAGNISPLVGSPDLSKLPVPPRHKAVSPTANVVQLTGGSIKSGGSIASGVSNLPKKIEMIDNTGDETAEEPHRGIAGSYDYKVDVKFAPPPKPSGSTSAASNKPSTKAGSTKPNVTKPSAPLPPPRSSSVTPGPPPAPPSRTGSGISVPSRPTTTTLPSNEEEEPTHPPPPYTLHSDSDPTPALPPTASQRGVNQFAPPPKPFRRNQDGVNAPGASIVEDKPEPPRRTSSIASAGSSFTLPPPARPPTSSISDGGSNTEAKKQSSELRPKPSISNTDDNSRPKKAPPPLAPKPSGINITKKTPPPIPGKKPQVTIPGKKTPPAVPKKKPSFQEHAAVSDFSKVVSELPQKNQDRASRANINNGIKMSDLGATKEDDDVADEEDNPFKRYLRNAVPKEDDRFHNYKK